MNDHLTSKVSEYREYIKNHIANVQASWKILQSQFPQDCFVSDAELKQRITNRVQNHDASKFFDDEFNGYRKFFYPSYKGEKNYDDFQLAWKTHYSRNDHHWEHWLDENGNPRDRGNARIETLVEMVCDWMAMGMQFGNTAGDYYLKNKNTIKLLQEDRAFVEHLLI
ncbi:hypothetical protein TRFO_31708 [Tritrichomonas foetus]|uniref:Uncharacterized protein n=1 Tax=Tritrichomonas foetus TaxID=1144522 RepID=A0A1J4JQN0_9EUKA|nr:hypothetical protein TRFO_31708 [Tritrichomonas foetus]|eukprot:OHT01479.1 hypothetical protein TRFO_31708 [Tritrichomonas foetus]